MVRQSATVSSSVAVVGIGAALLAASVAHHATEIGRIDRLNGPLLALTLDGVLSLGVTYGGYRLADSRLAPEHRWRVVTWCLLGITVLVGTTGAGILVRQLEGRVVSEPTFQLLLAADAGAVAGLVAGYYNARNRANARQAERATTTLRFVNDLFRHDVRNYVSAIVAHADLVESQTDAESVADSATTIREQADEVTELVENAGAIAETVAEDDDFVRIDLAAVVAESAGRVGEKFDVTVSTDLPEQAPVTANEAVQSVVNNLVENAAEHGAASGRAAAADGDAGRSDAERTDARHIDADDPQVELTVTNRGDSVRLRVADDGPGVADSRKAEIFEPRPESSHGGGLHLTETLVENYGGDVWVEDSDAGGAAFVVELPRHDAG
ncbi:ATP-binding protein [Halorussus aquaticus]|uniref:histidine kinase n=1 Tax=Halorussus aquaticus TaxID=2953748 RepID=A0ABD5PX50_9EURY|nr:ATP-binding protein [Halorussus aquaticus]